MEIGDSSVSIGAVDHAASSMQTELKSNSSLDRLDDDSSQKVPVSNPPMPKNDDACSSLSQMSFPCSIMMLSLSLLPKKRQSRMSRCLH